MNINKICTLSANLVIFFAPENWNDNGKAAIWRCTSYWKYPDAQCMAYFTYIWIFFWWGANVGKYNHTLSRLDSHDLQVYLSSNLEGRDTNAKREAENTSCVREKRLVRCHPAAACMVYTYYFLIFMFYLYTFSCMIISIYLLLMLAISWLV